MVFKKIKPNERIRLSGSPTVRFVRGQLFFNTVAMRSFFKGREFVELFWDAESKRVGVKPLEKPNEDSYGIRICRKGSRVGAVSASSLFKEIGEILKEKEVKTFPIKKEKEMLIVELGKK